MADTLSIRCHIGKALCGIGVLPTSSAIITDALLKNEFDNVSVSANHFGGVCINQPEIATQMQGLKATQRSTLSEQPKNAPENRHIRNSAEASRILSLERTIEFMKSQHASMLHALHEQIDELQTRCTDLTMKMTLKADPNVDLHIKLSHLNVDTELNTKDIKFEKVPIPPTGVPGRLIRRSHVAMANETSLRHTFASKGSKSSYSQQTRMETHRVAAEAKIRESNAHVDMIANAADADSYPPYSRKASGKFPNDNENGNANPRNTCDENVKPPMALSAHHPRDLAAMASIQKGEFREEVSRDNQVNMEGSSDYSAPAAIARPPESMSLIYDRDHAPLKMGNGESWFKKSHISPKRIKTTESYFNKAPRKLPPLKQTSQQPKS